MWRQEPRQLLASGPRVHRPRRRQTGRGHPHVPPPRCERAVLVRRRTTPLRMRNYVNVVVAGKQPALQLSLDRRCDHPLHSRESGCGSGRPLMATPSPTSSSRAAGTSPRSRRCAAAAILQEDACPTQGSRRQRRRPHAAPAGNRAPTRTADAQFDSLFTVDRPVVFAYHGYPWLIHRLTYRRTNHHNLHVRGYKEEGTTTTPFDIVMLSISTASTWSWTSSIACRTRRERRPRCAKRCRTRRLEARAYTREHGDDDPDIRDLTWPF